MDVTCGNFWETLVRLTWTSPPLPKSNHVCQYLAIFGGISPKLSLNKVFVYSRFWTGESHVWCITYRMNFSDLDGLPDKPIVCSMFLML